MGVHNSETHHAAPRCLLTLHERANGAELDGEGIQAWVEWEIEAMRWRVPVEIARRDLEALIASSEVFGMTLAMKSWALIAFVALLVAVTLLVLLVPSASWAAMYEWWTTPGPSTCCGPE